MNRLLSILLIPLFVLGQSLPHSHVDSVMDVPGDHAARPHVHVGCGHSHHHADEEHDHDHVEQGALDDLGDTIQSVVSLPVEHDSDAIYLAQSDCSLGRASGMGLPSFASVAAFVDYLPDRPVLAQVCYSKQTASHSTGPPIYLLVASFRL